MLRALVLLSLVQFPAWAQNDAEPKIDLESEPAAEAPKQSIPLDEQLDAIDRKQPVKPKASSNSTAAGSANTQPHAAPPAKIIPPRHTFSEPAEPMPPLPMANEEKSSLDKRAPWYRDLAEWVASRTIRDGLVGDEPTSKILTDGKRYDVSIGKRIPLIKFGDETLTRGWSVGFDGGMLVTLFRGDARNQNVTFASENFDGFFGGYIARALDDTILMYRVGHISSHLVDNNPQILRAIPYSRFWQEIIISQTLNSVLHHSEWDVHVQGALGLNFMSEPVKDGPRALLGIDVGRNLDENGNFAIFGSFDFRRPGVKNQVPNYSVFLGLGRLKRPETKGRPYKVGVSHHWGSDYRNQYYLRRSTFTSFEVQLEF